MFSYSLDDPETKRIKVQPHSKKKLTVSFLIVSSTCRWPEIKVLLVAVFFFSWQPTLDDKAACVSFSLCWLCPDFLFLTATQKTLAWDSASYSNQWTSEASFPGTFYYWNVKKGYMYMYYCSHGNLYRLIQSMELYEILLPAWTICMLILFSVVCL